MAEPSKTVVVIAVRAVGYSNVVDGHGSLTFTIKKL